MDDKLRCCLGHLESAETLLEAADDAAALAWLSLVIDQLRARHGLPDRPLDLAQLD